MHNNILMHLRSLLIISHPFHEILYQFHRLARLLRMHPVASIQRFQPHVREERLGHRDIMPIQIP